MMSLLKLLPQLLRQAGDSEEAREQAVFVAWAASVGEPVRKATAPLRVERKTLVVAVKDATWKKQLDAIRGQAVFRMNSMLGAPCVTAVEFAVNAKRVAEAHAVAKPVSFVAPEEQAMQFREHVDPIADRSIRETFLRAAGKCLDRRAR